jgi:hypothetical protein
MKFIFEETIAALIRNHIEENNYYFTILEQNFSHSFTLFNLELENQRIDNNNNWVELENIKEAGNNHHVIMMEQFSETKGIIQNESEQIKTINKGIIQQIKNSEEIKKNQFTEQKQLVTLQIENLNGKIYE